MAQIVRPTTERGKHGRRSQERSRRRTKDEEIPVCRPLSNVARRCIPLDAVVFGERDGTRASSRRGGSGDNGILFRVFSNMSMSQPDNVVEIRRSPYIR